jgi:hypothetical protein
MSFSRASLPIGHNGAMESVKDVIKYRQAYLFEYFLLDAICIKNVIIHEGYFLRFDIFDDQLRSFADAMQNCGIGC